MIFALAGEVEKRGWFTIGDNYGGDRTLEEQLTGLDLVCEYASGKTVLDLGCAEGLIGLHMMDRGASLLHGFSVLPSQIEVAQEMAQGKNANFYVLDLEKLSKALEQKPPVFLPRYGVVLLLSVLHKLRNPRNTLSLVMTMVDGMLAVRLPHPVIYSSRSGYMPCDVRAWLSERCRLVAEPEGPRGEWVGIFEKK